MKGRRVNIKVILNDPKSKRALMVNVIKVKIITIWDKWNWKKKEWEFNHIEDGFKLSKSEPQAVSEIQKKSWKNQKWKKEKAILRNGKVESIGFLRGGNNGNKQKC